MKNMKIKKKLIVSFLMIVALATIIGLIGIISTLISSSSTQTLSQRTTNAIASARLVRNIQQQRAAYRGAALYYLTEETDKLNAEYALFTDLEKDMNDLKNHLEENLTTSEGQQKLSTLQVKIDTYQVALDSLITILKQGDASEDEVMSAVNDMVKPAGELTNDMANLTDYINGLTNQQATASKSQSVVIIIILIITLVFAISIAISLSIYIANNIARPVNMMMGYLKQIGETGDLSFPESDWINAREEAKYQNEVSQSLAAFLKMLEQFIYYGECLETIANQDLTLQVETLSNHDTCGVSMKKMLESLNSVMHNINSSASQVASGSEQIAQASTNLATNSSEQASTIEKFSERVTEIQEMADDNTQTAGIALSNIHESGEMMVKSNEAMYKMLVAMEEINSSSQDISKIIKVIDDIAFQTNILALNAAVEAARAERHGRGFAVVADEVRNLASKSAEAAKETADLIEKSIHNVEEGSRIVTEVNERLKSVSELEEKSAESVIKMNDASKMQSEYMVDVTAGIRQLSSVVQANSATAEETAASSEEMSAQAITLNEIVDSFQLDSSISKTNSYSDFNTKKSITANDAESIELTYNSDSKY